MICFNLGVENNRDRGGEALWFFFSQFGDVAKFGDQGVFFFSKWNLQILLIIWHKDICNSVNKFLFPSSSEHRHSLHIVLYMHYNKSVKGKVGENWYKDVWQCKRGPTEIWSLQLLDSMCNNVVTKKTPTISIGPYLKLLPHPEGRFSTKFCSNN